MNGFHDLKKCTFPERPPKLTNYTDAPVHSTKLNINKQNERETEIKISGLTDFPTGESSEPRNSKMIDQNENYILKL